MADSNSSVDPNGGADGRDGRDLEGRVGEGDATSATDGQTGQNADLIASSEAGDREQDKPMNETEQPESPPVGEEEDTDSMDGSGLYSFTEEGEGDTRKERAKEEARRAARKRNRPSRGTSRHSSSSDEDEDNELEEEEEEEEDEQAMEAWLGAELRELDGPRWRAVPSLRAREIGQNSARFVHRVCGSRGLVQRLELQGRLERHTGCVNTLHFNPSGTRLASGSDDLRVVIWDWARRRAELEFDSGHKSNVFQAKFLPHSGDSNLAMCAQDGQIRIAELSATQRCKNTKRVAQHKGAAHKLALEPDSPCSFLSAGEDAVVYGIDLRLDRPANKLVVVKEGEKKVGLYTIFVNPANTHHFAVGGRDQYIRIYDQRKISENDNGVLKKFCPFNLVSSESKTNITCLVYSHDGSELLASYNDEDIYLFNANHSDGADYYRRYKGHRNNATVKGVNFYGPCSEFVVSGSDCGHIYLWDKHSARVVQFMEGDRGGVVNCLEPHPHLPGMATSGLDHDVKLWAPTAENPTNLKGLKEVMKKNKRERDEDSVRHGDQYDTQLLWFLMRHMRNRRPLRSRRGEAGEADTDESWSSPESTDDEDGGPDHVQCMSS
ncbi:DDB1- and CUL4-associated factor 8 isoform X2 [Brachyhypopomus gauderio]|uniref:DDB1- and CUL4-associated factor 8 isoform X2 n=1 Tax=Brachyhypopomus gauderio TaxID=698409 RepID=UPI0040418921